MKAISSLLFLLTSLAGFAQSDSTRFRSDLGLTGRRQTGTLSQQSLNPNLRLFLGNDKLSLESDASYQLLKVGDLKAVNDLWMNGILRVSSDRKFYGYADSYRIDHSLVAGAGVGINIINRSPEKFLQAHVYSGHYEVDFIEGISLSSPMVGSFIQANFPLDRSRLSAVWELHTYRSLEQKEFNGAKNTIQIRYHLFKGFNLTVNHSTLYNQTTGDGIAKTNTIMTFGFMHTLNKSF